jgi:hypothetical protein
MFRRKKEKGLPTRYAEGEVVGEITHETMSHNSTPMLGPRRMTFLKEIAEPKKTAPSYISTDKNGMEHRHFSLKPVDKER